jgi:TatD DNase family protein
VELIDSHTHLDFPTSTPIARRCSPKAALSGCGGWWCWGYQGNWQRLWDLVQSDADLYAAFGLHPVYLDQHRPETCAHSATG